MLDFKNMSDTKLNRWLELYELMPLIRPLFSTEIYKEAVVEAHNRFNGNQMYKNMYFVYINPEGTLTDFELWYRRFEENIGGV